ncbi:putative metalloprotease [Kribbella amoyensis]|uniref:Putative metalloprotease n=1 Tax=Kribbella amoyensis TaxID=996641 RepID=A0A561BSC0_9ACTN|nr:neutral zinc metallopeptidase [Kribbella amoyensis]TWD81784.1 putative metalloprotease [Kribbella amoyensis]
MADEPTPATPDPATPRPGHFLPGGAGESTDGTTGTPRQATRQPLALGKAQPVRRPLDPKLRKAAPLPTEPGQTGFGTPPPAPMPGASATPLTRTTQRGGVQSVGWHSASTRGAPQFSAQPPDLKPPRRFSKPLIAGLSVLVLLTVAAGGYGSVRLIDSYDDTVANPLARPSVKQTEPPLPAPPQPTVTVTVKPVPDAVRVKQNKLYAVGKLRSVRCVEPAIKPLSEDAILRYYRALLPCLNKTWAPLVRKAGYPFRAPKLVLYAKGQTACPGETDLAFYCGKDETITMRADQDLKNYRINGEGARVDMLDTLAHEYAHHVQLLTNILISANSREGWATTEAAKLEERRRVELQAGCLAAVFLGANKTTLGLTGRKLDLWQYQVKHSGDEYNPKKKRDHGSRKNHWLWAGPAFTSQNPASCNTFTAPPAKVS